MSAEKEKKIKKLSSPYPLDSQKSDLVKKSNFDKNISEKNHEQQIKFALENETFEAISKLLGVKLSSWPYSEESLKSMVQLRLEQEKSKQEELRTVNLKLSLDFLNQTKKMGIPNTLIPYMFLGSNSPEIEDKLQQWKSHNTSISGQIDIPLSPAHLSSFSSTPSRSRLKSKSKSNSNSTSISVTNSASVSNSTSNSNSNSISKFQFPPPGSSNYNKSNNSLETIIDHPSSSEITENYSQSSPKSRSPIRSHQRSHTVSGTPDLSNSTTVWKVNLPQNQQYQFHHWSGPGSKDGVPTSISGNDDANTIDAEVTDSLSTKRKYSTTGSGPNSPKKLSKESLVLQKITSSENTNATSNLGSPYMFKENSIGVFQPTSPIHGPVAGSGPNFQAHQSPYYPAKTSRYPPNLHQPPILSYQQPLPQSSHLPPQKIYRHRHAISQPVVQIPPLQLAGSFPSPQRHHHNSPESSAAPSYYNVSSGYAPPPLRTVQQGYSFPPKPAVQAITPQIQQDPHFLPPIKQSETRRTGSDTTEYGQTPKNT